MNHENSEAKLAIAFKTMQMVAPIFDKNEQVLFSPSKESIITLIYVLNPQHKSFKLLEPSSI